MIPSSSSYLGEDMLISTVLFLACFFHMFNLVKNVDVVELQWRCSLRAQIASLNRPVLQQPSRNYLSKHMEHLPFASAFC